MNFVTTQKIKLQKPNLKGKKIFFKEFKHKFNIFFFFFSNLEISSKSSLS